ncbi:MAG: potassium channel family protein [Candidatus Kapaibacterium sp.]
MNKILKRFVNFWESEFSLTIFFVSIILLNFVIIPFSDNFDSGTILEKTLYLLVIVSGAAALSENKVFKFLVSAFSVIAFVVWLFNRDHSIHWLDIIDASLQAIFFLILLVLILMKVYKGGVFTMERLGGAVAGFLLTANVFTAVYLMMSLIYGVGIFNVPNINIASLNHFSFITITTVGYGDIIPIHPVVRSLSNLEAVIGQLYPAVLIARLISLQPRKKQKEENL